MHRLLLLTLLLAPVAQAQSPRPQLPLNQGWRFVQGPVSGAENPKFDDSGWQKVQVPHTWNRLGNAGNTRSAESNSIQGQGWYRLHFTPPAAHGTERYFLQFDAVSTIAQVWLNGVPLGRHAGAFARFRFDASAAIKPGGDNVLVVEADNTRPAKGSSTQDVIPLSGDFFMFGGIYREVSLIVTHEAHVDLLDFGGPGLYVHPLSFTGVQADVQLMARLVDERHSKSPVAVEFAVEDAQGTRLAQQKLTASVGSASQSLKAVLKLQNIRRWQGRADPYLYRALVTVSKPGGELLDRVEERFGLREMRFDPDRGFFLNGSALRLLGVSRHQDRPIKGWALLREDQQQDFDLMQDMGANAVRFAHYQHAQASYELADERGFIAWAEIPLVNKVSYDGTPANEALSQNAKQQLTELIRQNYNHPSIATWSIANEVDLTPTQVKGPSQPAALLRALNELAHSEDPQRSTVLADCCEIGLPPNPAPPQDSAPRDAIAGITDILGYNRYFGWYVGSFEGLGIMLDAAHRAHPSLPLSVSEYGAGAALTQHSDDPAGGPINPHGRPHPEEYQNLYHEASWPQLKVRSYLWASFLWNMFDFASDSRREGDVSDINEKGLVSYDRHTLKDAYFYYRANWNPAPTLHLTGRRYDHRDYGVIEVKAYSNANSASLTVNGSEVGSTSCAFGICRWPGVQLKEGRNDIEVKAEVGGRQAHDALTWWLDHSPRVVRIKAGDLSGLTQQDGQRFGSDLYFNGGRAGGLSPPDTPESSRRAVNAPESALYGTYREGDFSYRVPLSDGTYRLTLKFAEVQEGAHRTFAVTANGKTLLDQFDIAKAAGGVLRGVERSFDTEVRGGELLLTFAAQSGPALLCALSIVPR